MSDEVDDARFPRVARYLQVLPNGLDSYPELEGKASPFRRGLDRFPVVGNPGRLPLRVAELLVQPPSMNVWLRATVLNAAYLALADYHGWSSEEYSVISYEVSRDLFRSPMYRALMVLASPERLLKTSGKRWPAFHRGTMLEVRLGTKEARMSLAFPVESYPELVGYGFLGAMKAAIVAARGRDVTTTFETWTSTYGQMSVRWR